MKFQSDNTSAFTVTAYGDGWLQIEGEQGGERVKHRVEHSVCLDPNGGYSNWECNSFEELTAEHFSQLLEAQPELIVFGSGDKIRFPKPEWIRVLIQKQIGVETMDTVAASRTYNILAAEGRKVLGVFLL